MPNPESSRDISIQSDGVKIGWNIMATLAAMGIGMYVFIVLTPLKADISNTVKELGVLQKLADTLDNRVDKCETAEAVINQRLKVLERTIINR